MKNIPTACFMEKEEKYLISLMKIIPTAFLMEKHGEYLLYDEKKFLLHIS